MDIFKTKEIKLQDLLALCKRPSVNQAPVMEIVKPVVDDIRKNGLEAALNYARKFDGFTGSQYLVSAEEYESAAKRLAPRVKTAIENAAANIRKFHEKQKPSDYETLVRPGVRCSREYRAIENVGLYIPGGSAVLPSTMLMLGIPASIAGCKRVMVCSPAREGKINDPLLYAASIAGVTEFYKIGGSQAVAFMAYGNKSSDKYPFIRKADKIFGPGNQYVTAAKMLVSNDISGCAIDMPAGPSELLVIADDKADPRFVAADLLSQAEHGPDSQVIFITDSQEFSERVISEIQEQIKILPRRDIAAAALGNSFCIISGSIEEAIEISNEYAPEHLSLQIDNPDIYKSAVSNAGSVFLGSYSPESAGDYASGTNHSLPTSSFSRSMGGVSVESFMKTLTFQNLSREGLLAIAETIEILAEVETLQAHKNAVSVRVNEK